jgi:hypothetical protein
MPLRLLPPLLLLALPLVACSDPPSLVIRIQQPAAGLDLASAEGRLRVELLDGNTGAVEQRREVTADGLATGRQRLFESLELIEERSYRVRLVASLDGKKSCARAVGLSPTFRYDEALTELSVYMDCADAASTAAPLQTDRAYHQAVFLPAPAPHGQVVLVAGASPRTDLAPDDPAKFLDSIEVYNPGEDRFTRRTERLSRPRALHVALRIGDQLLLSLGGMDTDKSGGTTVNEILSYVDRVSADAVTRVHDLTTTRAGHSAVLLEDQGKVLVAGGFTKGTIIPLMTLEIFDPAGKGKPPQLPSMTIPRYQPALVPFERGRRVLIAGGLWVKDKSYPIDLLCLSGSCTCGTPPCVQQLPGFGQDAGRIGVTGTLVPCRTGGGAIYLVGGFHTETTPVKKTVLHDDIRCVDTANPGQGPTRLGGLLKPRGQHTTTLVRGGKSGQRLLVAGGYSAEGVLSTRGELVPVSCDCKLTGAIKEVELGFRVGHTATLLADGTVLLAGGLSSDKAERFNPDF